MAQAVKKSPGIESTLGALIAHPTRVKSYVILNERVASPNEIALETNLAVGHVSYHVDKLKELKVIELVDERPVRGAIEHFYRAVRRPVALEAGLKEMTEEERDSLTRYTLQLALADAALAINAGTFDARLNRALVRVPMTVDEEGFAKLASLHEEMYQRHLEIEAESAGRMADEKTEAIPTVAVHMFFEMPSKRVR
ncbi:MAG TPA: winged helix-turn-helix domain-containing protein [Solirubrobacterales bacterium]|jgi:DNA-binding transcriptional ArsR family regulator|nr:winged helix-turn-helix domain-containing protein [Solirubrobacterales bacterium]